MKNKIFGTLVVVAIAVGAMINVNLNKVSNKGDLALANVEALAQENFWDNPNMNLANLPTGSEQSSKQVPDGTSTVTNTTSTTNTTTNTSGWNVNASVTQAGSTPVPTVSGGYSSSTTQTTSTTNTSSTATNYKTVPCCNDVMRVSYCTGEKC